MNSVSILIDRVKEGSDQAATDLWARYYSQLISLARSKLGSAPRRTMDEDDVVVQAFASFCLRAGKGQFPDLKDRDDLWKLLICIAERKALNQRKHLFRKKNQAVPEAALQGKDGAGGLDILASPVPSPEFAEILADEVASLLDQLEDPVYRLICIQKMEGLSNPQIAKSLECSVSSVERKLRNVRDVLNHNERSG